MRFRVLYNNGNVKYFQARSNAAGDEVEERLKTIKMKGNIRDFERIDFVKITPDDIMKTV